MRPGHCHVANKPCQNMCLDGCEIRKPEQHDPQHPYVRTMKGCGHGVLFTDYCKECEVVGLMDEYKRAVRTVQRVRDRMRVLGQTMPGFTS